MDITVYIHMYEDKTALYQAASFYSQYDKFKV